MKPILFNTEMVRAILDGRKTVTRRLIRPQPHRDSQLSMGANMDICHAFDDSIEHPGPNDRRVYMAPYNPGDVLYVRETWAPPFLPDSDEIRYRADYNRNDTILREGPYPDSVSVVNAKWHPSIHMPREAARLFLLVTDVRAERLQQITEIGARNEGADSIQIAREIWSCRKGFERIWDSTINPVDLSHYGWAANPWVWVIEFERCENPDERSL